VSRNLYKHAFRQEEPPNKLMPMNRSKAFIFVLFFLFTLYAAVSPTWAIDNIVTSMKIEGINGYYPKLYVNQSVNFTAQVSGGTPPYRYEWYYHIWPDMILVSIPSASNSSKLTFTPTSPGTYTILLRVTDSLNATGGTADLPPPSRFSQGQHIFVIDRTASPSPQLSTSPAPSASATPLASSSSSPSPSQTLNPSASPTLTVEPSPSQSASSTHQPTSSPNQPTLQQAYYIVAAVAVGAIVVAVALLLRNRQRTQAK
jgi:hypothetical protein